MKRQKRTVGSFVKIPLGDGTHTYGRLLPHCIAVYNARGKQDITDMKAIEAKKVLCFINAVYSGVITKGEWLKVGKLPVDEDLDFAIPNFYIWHSYEPDLFSFISGRDGQIHYSTKEKCLNLPAHGIFEAGHVAEYILAEYGDIVDSTLHRKFCAGSLKNRLEDFEMKE